MSFFLICRIDTVSKLNSEPHAIGALVEHSWRIMEHIMRNSYALDVNTFALHFYLNVCGMVTALGDSRCLSKLPHLANYVERVIRKLLQHCNCAYGSIHKFGGGDPKLFGHEFGVSGLQVLSPIVRSDHQKFMCCLFLQIWVGLLTPRYPGTVESGWHKVCDQKLSERLSKVCTRICMLMVYTCSSSAVSFFQAYILPLQCSLPLIYNLKPLVSVSHTSHQKHW